PDLSISEMREPFDELIPAGEQLSEATGLKLAAWAAGGAAKSAPGGAASPLESPPIEEKPSITDAQAKKANVLVGQLRDAGHITTEQLWRSTGREPVVSEDGELHWSRLRDSLSKDQASALIDRLERYQANVAVTA
ncbi:MAG TPA: hypothetical protein VIO57_14805, partial [Chloroflexota bacterium]